MNSRWAAIREFLDRGQVPAAIAAPCARREHAPSPERSQAWAGGPITVRVRGIQTEKSLMSDDIVLLGCTAYASPWSPPAEALLVRDGSVSVIGSESEVRAAAQATARVEHLNGATVTAGFTDSHIHLTAWALALGRPSLVDAGSPQEAAERVARQGSPVRGVIRGHGWNRNRWERAPAKEDLDRWFPDTPVFLDSQDLHAAWLNSAALRLCGVGPDIVDPPGGVVGRDPITQEPTGLLLDAARARALSLLPDPSEADVVAALLRAQSELHSLGISGVHSVEPTGRQDFHLLRERGDLRLRVLQHVQLDQLETAIGEGLRSGSGDEWVRVGGVKIFLDGSLGSRTAWLTEPYTGTDDERGIRMLPEGAFRDAVQRSVANGLSATVHAIGDAAVELALDVLGSTTPSPSLPHRIEHLQLCPPRLWERAATSGIVGSMQPVHILTDIAAAERFWGPDRSQGAFPIGTLMRRGMVLAFGSDAPVESPDPRPGLFGAVARGTWREYQGRIPVIPGWFPEHRASVAEAVAAYTIGPAKAAGTGNRRGRLLPGFDADLVAWSADPFLLEPERYGDMRCLLTMVGGEIVFREG
jgi:predicted amidohydrolase YtcJ